MNLLSRMSLYAALALVCLGLNALQARAGQQPDTLRFDPQTGEPLGPKPKPAFDPVTGLPKKAGPTEEVPVPFDPETGLPLEAESREPTQPSFDPETGEPILPQASPKAPLTYEGVGLVATLKSVIAAAKAEAVRSHNAALHQIAGAAGCLFSLIGLPITTLYVESGALSKFDKNSASSAAVYYRGLSPGLQLVYERAYKKKEKSLRRNSVYGTQGLIFGGCCVLLLIGGL